MASEGGEFDTLSLILYSLNSNPYLIGFFMLMLNLGGRFLAMELTPRQEAFLQQRWLRPLLFFIVLFVATRNLAVAFWITLFLFVILWVLANEKSPFCLISSWREYPTGSTDSPSEAYKTNMDAIETMNAMRF